MQRQVAHRSHPAVRFIQGSQCPAPYRAPGLTLRAVYWVPLVHRLRTDPSVDTPPIRPCANSQFHNNLASFCCVLITSEHVAVGPAIVTGVSDTKGFQEELAPFTWKPFSTFPVLRDLRGMRLGPLGLTLAGDRHLPGT